MDGDRPHEEVEFEANGSGTFGSRLGEEFDELGRFENHRRGCGTGAMIAEGGESKAAAAAECGLAQVAAVEGVEDLAPLSGSAGAAHAAPSRGSRRTVDGPGRALTAHLYSIALWDDCNYFLPKEFIILPIQESFGCIPS